MLNQLRAILCRFWPLMLKRTHHREITRWSEYEDTVARGHAKRVRILSERIRLLESNNGKLEAQVTVRARMMDELKATWRPPQHNRKGNVA